MLEMKESEICLSEVAQKNALWRLWKITDQQMFLWGCAGFSIICLEPGIPSLGRLGISREREERRRNKAHHPCLLQHGTCSACRFRI